MKLASLVCGLPDFAQNDVGGVAEDLPLLYRVSWPGTRQRQQSE